MEIKIHFYSHPETHKDPVETTIHIQEANMDNTTQTNTHIKRAAAGYMTTEKRAKSERKTTRKDDRRILRQALVDPTVTRSTIRADANVAIVPQTVSRHLAEANLKSKHTFRALPLTPEHRQLRLQWCQARSMWNVTDWQKVVFSDEYRFILGTDDNRVRVWRRPGVRYNAPTLFYITLPAQLVYWVSEGQFSSRIMLVRIQQELLKTSYVSFRLFHGRPPPTPDLSPVEHVWDQLKWQMPSCYSVQDSELALQDLWAHLPQDNIRSLINSIEDRVAACIATGGGPTRY
ncbi:transposable element Tcb2 transposase [Trichonephila clavipes]|nr:transposable element Tcb2 transposase [Trichonephila clavipes]